MLETIRPWAMSIFNGAYGIIRYVVNSVYDVIMEIAESLRFLDMPGTYIVWMVIGFIYVPFLARSVYNQYADPHGYYYMPLTRKVVMGIIFIVAWIVLGYANFIRFLRH